MRVRLVKDLGGGRRRGLPVMKQSQVYPLLFGEDVVLHGAKDGRDPVAAGSKGPPDIRQRWCS